MAAPLDTIDVWVWSGCPTGGEVAGWMERICADAGLPAPRLRFRSIETDDEARELGFIGSPTFVIGGADPFPRGDAPTGLTCRIYRRRDGRPSPLPDPADMIDLLRGAGEPVRPA